MKTTEMGSDSDPMVGRTLDGRFTILAKLGAGSMGTVYRARQNAINRDVAIKILRSDRATDETAKARFLREARANSLLASPHTVTVFDFGQSESGEFYLAMELLEGESLGQRLHREKRLPVDIAVETTRQALRSLAEAHAKGIIHRDLKPDNLFFARVRQGDSQVEESVKVLDFGIAKLISGEDAAPLNAVETQAGTVFGTPRYMSPEQAQGKPLDARSDLYSLAVILYQMLTGRPPFTDNDAIVVMARHIKTAPKPPTEACPEANIPPELEAALTRALAKDPKNRPATAEQMSNELARSLDQGATVSSGVRSVRPSAAMPVASAANSAPPAAPSAPEFSAAVAPLESSVALPEELRPRRRGPLMLLVAIAAIAAVLVVGFAVMKRDRVRRSSFAAGPPAQVAAPASPPPPSTALGSPVSTTSDVLSSAATSGSSARAEPGDVPDKSGPPVFSTDNLPKASTRGNRAGSHPNAGPHPHGAGSASKSDKSAASPQANGDAKADKGSPTPTAAPVQPATPQAAPQPPPPATPPPAQPPPAGTTRYGIFE